MLIEVVYFMNIAYDEKRASRIEGLILDIDIQDQHIRWIRFYTSYFIPFDRRQQTLVHLFLSFKRRVVTRLLKLNLVHYWIPLWIL